MHTPYYARAIALGNRNSRNPGNAAGRGRRELTWYPHLTTCMWDTWSVRAGSTMHLHCMMKFYVESFPGSGTASTAAARYSVALQPPRVMAACCGDTVSRRSWLDRAERDTMRRPRRRQHVGAPCGQTRHGSTTRLMQVLRRIRCRYSKSTHR